MNAMDVGCCPWSCSFACSSGSMLCTHNGHCCIVGGTSSQVIKKKASAASLRDLGANATLKMDDTYHGNRQIKLTTDIIYFIIFMLSF